MPAIPEIAKQIIGSVVRHLLTGLFTYLAAKNIVTGEQVEWLIAGATGVLIALGWSIWQKVKSRVAFLTALALPENASEEQVKQQIKTSGTTVSVLLLACAILGSTLVTSACGDDQYRKAEEGIRKVYVGLSGAGEAIDIIYESKVARLQASMVAGVITEADFQAQKQEAARAALNGREALKQVGLSVKQFKEQVRALPSITVENKVQLFPLLDQLVANIEKARQSGIIDVPRDRVVEIEAMYELLKGGAITLKGVIAAIKKPVPVSAIPALTQ
jgi:hypothetical protein